MRYALTGAGGFLGWHVKLALQASGASVRVAARSMMTFALLLAGGASFPLGDAGFGA